MVVSLPAGQIPDQLWPGPEPGQRFRHRLGLRPLDPANWFLANADTPALLAAKHKLLSDVRDDVLFVAPEALDGCLELCEMISDHLSASGAGAPRTSDIDDHPLVQAGSLVADDLVLLDTTDPGIRIAAMFVCAPNRWKPAVKFGNAMIPVHRPVPGYEDDIGQTVDAYACAT